MNFRTPIGTLLRGQRIGVPALVGLGGRVSLSRRGGKLRMRPIATSSSRRGDVAFERRLEQLAAALLGQRKRVATGGRIFQRHFNDRLNTAAVHAKVAEVE